MHKNSVCHRDIKPDNILVSADGNVVKITDFNISKFSSVRATKITHNIKMWTNTGTVNYLAPEILNDEPYTEAVDMWSVGIVLYIMLCGSHPFMHEY
jgi:serine/threonine protein kinase